MNYKIVGKYIKNLDFKIPNPEIYSLLSKEISNYKINIDIKSNQIKDNLIEVETSLSLITNKENTNKINAKIILATIIELPTQSFDKQELEKIILIKVPSNIYSELRKIFLFLFENSGFKEIKINETVDFEELYKKRNQ
ncbi:protein-export chaperone SecB [Candidatus Pelagibacter bacterium]|nr:protein-export chaperone SecB [Candidatus Pelagibacter bacterium]|tara:strand:+ start:128 stop:544 length:417 start_codon:yes stop_codon:yes gene_type:complete